MRSSLTPSPEGQPRSCARDALPTCRAHNEQAMAHTAIAFAKASRPKRMMACTSSIGPGAATRPMSRSDPSAPLLASSQCHDADAGGELTHRVTEGPIRRFA